MSEPALDLLYQAQMLIGNLAMYTDNEELIQMSSDLMDKIIAFIHDPVSAVESSRRLEEARIDSKITGELSDYVKNM